MKKHTLVILSLVFILSACSLAVSSPDAAVGHARFEGRWLAAFNLEINTRLVQINRPWLAFIIDLQQQGDQVIGSMRSDDINVTGTLHGIVDSAGVFRGTMRLSWDTHDWESLTLRISPDGMSGIGTAIYPAAADEWHFYTIHLLSQTGE